MSANAKIENALKEMVDGNIWALKCPLEKPPTKWIVHNPETFVPSDFGDNEAREWTEYYQVHYFQRGVVNYRKIKNDIRKKLKEAGFSITEIRPDYESNTDVTHITFSVNMVED